MSDDKEKIELTEYGKKSTELIESFPELFLGGHLPDDGNIVISIRFDKLLRRLEAEGYMHIVLTEKGETLIEHIRAFHEMFDDENI